MRERRIENAKVFGIFLTTKKIKLAFTEMEKLEE